MFLQWCALYYLVVTLPTKRFDTRLDPSLPRPSNLCYAYILQSVIDMHNFHMTSQYGAGKCNNCDNICITHRFLMVVSTRCDVFLHEHCCLGFCNISHAEIVRSLNSKNDLLLTHMDIAAALMIQINALSRCENFSNFPFILQFCKHILPDTPQSLSLHVTATQLKVGYL